MTKCSGEESFQKGIKEDSLRYHLENFCLHPAPRSARAGSQIFSRYAAELIPPEAESTASVFQYPPERPLRLFALDRLATIIKLLALDQ